MTHAPQWVREACKLWGRQKRRAWAGGDWHRDHAGVKRWHVDGYAQSFLARIQDERVAAGSGSIAQRQHWVEVYLREGLDVQCALGGVPEIPHAALHLHYVFDPDFGVRARDKARFIGLTANGYWLAVASAEHAIWRRLDPLAEQKAPVIPLIPLARRMRVRVRHSGISFEPLCRPILSRHK